MGEYIPQAPINDEAKKHNGNLPGMGGVFNYVNFHVYHYAGNNPVKLVDPDGRSDVVDLNLYPKDESVYQYVEDLKTLPKEVLELTSREDAFVVALHGHPDYVLDENRTPITPKNLADRIRGHKNYRPGQTIVLLSCEVGGIPIDNNENFAKRLADELGANVLAPDNVIWFYQSGSKDPIIAPFKTTHSTDNYFRKNAEKVYKQPPSDRVTGTWKLFPPRRYSPLRK